MKVAFPLLSLYRSGGEKVILRLANALSRRGHVVTIIIPKGKISSEIVTDVNVVEVNALPLYNPVFSAIFPTPIVSLAGPLARALRGNDVIVANYSPTSLPCKLAQDGRVRLCYLIQHDETKLFSPVTLEHWVARLSYGAFRSGRIFTVSTWLEDLVKKKTGQDAIVVPPGIDHEAYYPRERVTHEEKEVLFISRPGKWRGIDVLLEAARTVNKEIGNFRLIAAGRQQVPLRTRLDVQYITPSDEELANRYSSSNAFVLPSILEGLPVPPLEAMACGGVVVLTDCGGTRDYAINEANCIMVPPGDPESLADAIIRVLSDEQLSRRLRTNGPLTAAAWTYERMERIFIDGIEGIGD